MIWGYLYHLVQGWCFGTSIQIPFFHIFGISSSQLTFICVRGVETSNRQQFAIETMAICSWVTLIYLLKMETFHSYVSWPEGIFMLPKQLFFLGIPHNTNNVHWMNTWANGHWTIESGQWWGFNHQTKSLRNSLNGSWIILSFFIG